MAAIHKVSERQMRRSLRRMRETGLIETRSRGRFGLHVRLITAPQRAPTRGGGILAKALQIQKQKRMEAPGERVRDWSAWTEKVRRQLEEDPELVRTILEEDRLRSERDAPRRREADRSQAEREERRRLNEEARRDQLSADPATDLELAEISKRFEGKRGRGQ